MKKKALLGVMFLLFAVQVFAQTNVTLFPDLVNGSAHGRDPDTTWTNVTGGSSATFEFHFYESKRYRNLYSGSEAVFVFVDTTTAGDGQGLRAYARPLIYDKVSNQYEKIVEPNASDSTNIAQNFNWQTNHDDNSYSLSKALNFLISDGVFVKVFADSSNAAFKIRVILKQAVDKTSIF